MSVISLFGIGPLRQEKLYIGFNEADRELVSPRDPDIVEKAFGKTCAHDLEPEGMHVRLNGHIYGPYANPRNTITPFMRMLIEQENFAQFESILSTSHGSDGQTWTTRRRFHKGNHTLGLWDTSCGQHIIKRINSDEIYTLYAQFALLNSHTPLVPRIDAIVETPSSGVFVVMERLLSFDQVPAAVRVRYLDNNGYDQSNLRQLKRSILEEYGLVSQDLGGSILSALAVMKPDDVCGWANPSVGLLQKRMLVLMPLTQGTIPCFVLIP